MTPPIKPLTARASLRRPAARERLRWQAADGYVNVARHHGVKLLRCVQTADEVSARRLIVHHLLVLTRPQPSRTNPADVCARQIRSPAGPDETASTLESDRLRKQSLLLWHLWDAWVAIPRDSQPSNGQQFH